MTISKDEIKRKLGVDIIQSANTSKKLEKLSNEELGKLLFYHLWVDMNLFTLESDLVIEIVKRLGFDPEGE